MTRTKSRPASLRPVAAPSHTLPNGIVIRIYDNGGETVDRYTVVYDCPNDPEQAAWNAGRRMVPTLGCSRGGRAYSEFSLAQEGPHLGEPVRFQDLDTYTAAHITSRLAD